MEPLKITFTCTPTATDITPTIADGTGVIDFTSGVSSSDSASLSVQLNALPADGILTVTSDASKTVAINVTYGLAALTYTANSDQCAGASDSIGFNAINDSTTVKSGGATANLTLSTFKISFIF